MTDEVIISQLSSSLDGSQSVMVVLSADPSVDELAAATALYGALLNVGKNVRLVAPRIPQVLSEIGDGVVAYTDRISQALGNENLTISFEYSEDQVDKVSYHIGEETGKFHLTIRPKPGFAPLDSSTVEFGYTGASADLIFLVGVSSLDSLEQLYFGYEDLYQNTPIVSIDQFGTTLGAVQLKPEYHASLSELMTTTLGQLGLAIDSDVATGLLYGIEQFSHNLTAPETEPETFEAVAQLLRSGARRVSRTTFVKPQASSLPNQMSFGEALRNTNEAKEIPLKMAEEEMELVEAELRATRKLNQQLGEAKRSDQPTKKRRRRRRMPTKSDQPKTTKN